MVSGNFLRRRGVGLVVCAAFLAGCGTNTSTPPAGPIPAIHKSEYSTVLWPAVERAYKQVEAEPGSAEANGRLAIVLHAGGKYELGERFYQRAIARDASFRWQYYLSQLQTLKGAKGDALRTLEGALRKDDRYVPARLKYARLLLEANRAEEARQHLEATLKQAPDSAVAEFDLGRVLRALNRKEESIQHLERACARVPQYGAAQYALAVAYRDAGRAAEAKERFRLYEQYKNRLPEQEDPLEREFLAAAQGRPQGVDQANEALRRGDLTGAAQAYEAALAKDGESVAIRSSLIAVYYKLGNWGQAEAHYREAVKQNPQYADAHYHYGMALLAQRRGTEAAAAFRLAIEAHGTHAGALTQWGLLREKSGDNAGATESYRKALASDPRQRQALFLLGRQLVQAKRYDEGIGYLEKTIAPDDEQTPWFLRVLAGAHGEAGRPKEALRLAEEAKVKAEARRDQRLLPLLQQDLAKYSQMAAGR